MIFPKTKLKNQLALINALSKLLIILLSVFLIPWLVRDISINDTDNQLIDKLDLVYELVEEQGIEEFIGVEDQETGFGSYNILKEEYISIEITTDTVLSEYIDNSQRLIEDLNYDYRVISAVFQYEDKFYLIEIGKSINSIISFERNLKKFAFYFLIILLSLTIVFDLSITQLLLRPFDLIIQKLKKAEHPTKFDYTPTITTTSDFLYLEENIHGLMQKIETAFQNERDFIGDISHEILTPISIIRSKLDNFANTSSLSDDEMIKIIESKMTLVRLTKLVRTLLLMSRIDNQEYLTNEQIDIDLLVENVLQEMSERFEIKELEIKFQNRSVAELNEVKKGSNILISGNRELLHILFFNIISNAIKYTPSGGKISINSQLINNDCHIIIKDTGIGIKTENIPYIFDRFKKFQESENNFGLGLSLAKKIADHHGILIEVNSEIKQGTIFSLIFKK